MAIIPVYMIAIRLKVQYTRVLPMAISHNWESTDESSGRGRCIVLERACMYLLGTMH